MSLSTLSVMVVEHQAPQRRAAVRLLQRLGVGEVDDANDGPSALALLAQRHRPPDVVMVDPALPGMDGIEFIGHLARRGLARSLLVVSALDPALLHTVQAMATEYGLRVLGIVDKPLVAASLGRTLAGFAQLAPAFAFAEAVDVGATEIRQALAHGEIVAWFQPQVMLDSGRPVGVEALARWVRADGQVVSPQHFIALLAREGLTDALTDVILDQACRWKGRWQARGWRLTVSVNVSPTTLADPTSADRYQRIAAARHVDPAEVVLELTESAVLGDVGRALGVLARLRLKGFGLAIDDFGTGYSSLAQLSRIPFTELKIDQDFVIGAHAQPRHRAVVETSLDLARKLGLNVVAEGVTTVEDWRMLAGLGCSMAQGNLISPPVPGEALVGVLARWRPPA